MALLLAWLVHAQSYDFYTPAKGAGAPVLVFLHGGAWRGGHKEDYRGFAERLTKKNVCVAVVEYRLSHEARHPAPVEDLENALRTMKPPAGCDRHRLFLVGHSAGAHLIAYWATRNANPDVLGFIGLEGIYDLPELVRVWPAYADQFVKPEFGAAEKWAAASPARLKMRTKAPWLLVHSEADELVDAKQATLFRDHLASERVKVELLRPKDESHFGVIESTGKSSELTEKLLGFVGAR